MNDIIKFIEEISDYLEGQHWGFRGFVDEPEGVLQDSDCELFEYEYVDQHGSDDRYYGFIYFPMINGKFLKIEYYF